MSAPATTRLLWAVHNHQPVGNFDFVFEHAYQHAYLRFVEVLERHPTIGVDFHFSGPLLDWLETAHPEYLELVAELAAKGQAGILAGAYYEPILPPIPYQDQVGQIQALVARLKKRFGSAPKGMWLAERVWEPGLPAAISDAGIEFTLLDGTHFKQVGFGEETMFGRWTTESEGKAISVFPIHDGVRDLIPFASVEEAIAALRKLAMPGGRDVVFGDDGEKFGDWPGTHALCYEQGWLDRFFTEIERDPTLSVRPVSEAYGDTRSQGLVYLPAASYFEMMEWAETAQRQTALRKGRDAVKAAGVWDTIQPFVRGVSWRNFLIRYPESNRMHKLAQSLSGRIHAELAGTPTPARKKVLLKARDHVWQGQCNCGYWHGVFGGLYLPHLRRALHGNLARAERLLEGKTASVVRRDWDLDGHDEVELRDAEQFVSVHLGQGAGIPVWWLDRAGLNLTDSMTRQEETYHARIAGVEGKGDGTKLADQFDGANPELARLLRYDEVPNHSGLDFWFPQGTDAAVWQEGKASENWLGGAWEVKASGVKKDVPFLQLVRESGDLQISRTLRLLPSGGVEVDIELHNHSDRVVSGSHGSQWLFCLLAGDAHDRILTDPSGSEHRLDTLGDVTGSTVSLRDGWLELEAKLASEGAQRVLWQGIRTVNQSVGGYETVYQGTSVLVLRTVEIPAGGKLAWKLRLDLTQSKADRPL
jgi:4-alpha-glucanotransferase